jgi:hypothetical protein
MFLHYLENTQSFQLETPLQGLEEFLVCFDQMDSLLRTSKKLQIDKSNVNSFIFISEKLDNSNLTEACFSISHTQEAIKSSERS